MRVPLHKTKNAIRRIKSKMCPFCGETELYAYPPRLQRPWWIVGCESVTCDSSWRIEKDRLESVESMINHAHKLQVGKPTLKQHD